MRQIDIAYVNNFTGYKNHKDVTALSPTDITEGSKNVLIHAGGKIEVRGGTDFLGAKGTSSTGEVYDPYWTRPKRIHSNFENFTNSFGTNIPLRIYYSGNSTDKDIVEAYLSVYDSNGEDTGEKKWYHVASGINSKHKYFWAEWWDNIMLKPLLVFVNGTSNIHSWTGGIGIITDVNGSDITLGMTFAESGFVNNANGGSDNVVINGTSYSTNGSFNSNTLTVSGLSGVMKGDLVFQGIRTVNAKPSGDYQFDVCSMVNNQVYYIDWRQKNVYISWNRNQDERLGVIKYFGTSGLDDAIFDGAYTGDTAKTFNVTIDSVRPGEYIEEQSLVRKDGFIESVGSSYFDTSGFTMADSDGERVYKVLAIADRILTPRSATLVGTFNGVGEIVIGRTSGATGIMKAANGIFNGMGAGSGGNTLIEKIYGEFLEGEVVVGQNSGASVELLAVQQANLVQAYKDGVLLTSGVFPSHNPSSAYSYQISLNTKPFSLNPITFPDGILFNPGEPFNLDTGDYYELRITKVPEGPDTFSKNIHGEDKGSLIDITTGDQSIGEGVTVRFLNDQGHHVGDSWSVTAYPRIRDGYANFTFSAPDRMPGEGMKLMLDTNGWGMAPQENAMYINGVGGEWYQVQMKLSDDLLTETLSIQRLKTEPRNRLINPYTIGYMKNYMVYVSNDMTFDIIGRQESFELPQARSLSDEVRYDFTRANWDNAVLNYQFRKQFFTLPEEKVVYIYDDYEGYWHPPMTFPRPISAIAIIDGKICGHSDERNETYELFTESDNDLGEFPIESDIVFPYYDGTTERSSARFTNKDTSAFACDGYIDGNADIKVRLNFGVGGCDGIVNLNLDPKTCVAPDEASLGKSKFGYHGLGNSPVKNIPHFTYGETFSKKTYYQRNIELSCRSLHQKWSITSVGTDMSFNNANNQNIFNINR